MKPLVISDDNLDEFIDFLTQSLMVLDGMITDGLQKELNKWLKERREEQGEQDA